MKAVLKHTMFIALILVSSQGFAQNTTLQTVSSRIPSLVKMIGLNPIGQMDTTAQLSFTIGLQLQNRQAFDQLLQNLYDPKNTEYRQFLSHQQVVQEFCPTEADYQTVVSFVESHGLSVTRQYADHMLLGVRGSIAAIQRALHVKMLLYKHPTENRNFYAPDAAPSVDLSTPIQAITGLSNFFIPRPALVTNPMNEKTTYPTITSGSINGSYDGNDLRAAYLQNVSLNGHGQKVGILEFVQLDTSNGTYDGGFYPHDITLYDSISGVPQVPVGTDNIDGQSETPNPETVDEFSVDIEMANAMAPGMDSIIVYYGWGPDEILDAMLANTSVKQFSASWILWPDGNTPGQLKIMAAQGQTFFNASGDQLVWASAWPAYGDPRPYDEPPFAGYATDTGATIVGGTQLSTNGPGGSYASETVWNEGNDVKGSGGGYEEGSFAENIPSYQLNLSSVNGASNVYRNGPDVAMVASNIMEVARNGQVFSSNGTSFATPLWAGYMALVNQQAAANGNANGVGFINLLLYSLGEGNSYNSCFNDVQTGNNYYTSSSGTIGYKAGPSYDLCTGWGSPNGQNGQTLINFLAGTVWNHTVVLNSSYTIPSGGTLIIEPGTTVQLASGATITASGVLNAVGTSSDPITFTSSGSTSPGSWGSIVFNGSGADNSTMKYVNMSYGTGVSVSNCSGVTIENCTFSANSSGVIFTNTQGDLLVDNTVPSFESGDAVVIQQSATAACRGNTIYSNGQYQNTGIWFYQGGGGTLSGNDIDHFFFGVDMSEGASPYFANYPYSYSVNNRIADNAEGLVINQDSYPDMYDGSSCGGGNSIYGNTIADIELDQETYSMTAYYNYWNGGNPGNAKLIVGSGCAVNDGLFNTTNYWASTPIPSVQSRTQTSPSIVSGADRSALMADTPGEIQTSPPVVTDSAGSDPLFDGIKYRDEGNFGQAASFFMSYLAKHPDDQQAYAELYACADSETTPGLIQFFKALPNQASKEQQLLLALLYERQGDIQPAVQVDDQIIHANPNTGLAFSAEMNKFLVALYSENNPQLASTILDTLSGTQDTSVSRQLILARNELDTYVDPSTGKMPFASGALRSSSMKTQVSASQLPKTFGLSQDYPNPFNPTTTIEYQIPKDAHVTLRVYNVLGQLVATLVDGEVSAGYHQAIFNGSRFASGVYIYRLTTPTYSKVMKMLELK